MPSNPEIQTAAIIPAYNEANTIGAVVSAALQSEEIDGVIVVDDGSTDNTLHEACTAARLSDTEKPFNVLVHHQNEGKTEALMSGVERARELGSVSLSTLVFLDADSSPVWSRDTVDNMKLWQIAVSRLSSRSIDTLNEKILLGRQPVFTALLARYINEITQPVTDGTVRMRMGMYERNVITDTFLTIVNWGGHAGNRAIKLVDWDTMLQHAEKKGVTVQGWEIEAALNSYIPDIETSSFIMRGVVNVGSRKKAGSTIKGLLRMATIHGQAMRGALKFR